MHRRIAECKVFIFADKFVTTRISLILVSQLILVSASQLILVSQLIPVSQLNSLQTNGKQDVRLLPTNEKISVPYYVMLSSAGATISQKRRVNKQNRDFYDTLLNDDDNDDAMTNSSAVVIRAVAFVVTAAYYHQRTTSAAIALLMSRRRRYHVRDRIKWGNHVAQLNQEGNNAFSRLYIYTKSYIFIQNLYYEIEAFNVAGQ